MMYLTVFVLSIPSFLNLMYIFKKEEKLKLELDKKIKDKGYEKTNDNSDLFSLIADKVGNSSEYSARLILSMFPVANLYTFILIIIKKLEKEYDAILNSLDNRELLDSLEEDKYIYNQNTILKKKEDIVNGISEINKANESNNQNNNSYFEISENDSLEQLKQKKALLNEMIYLKNLEEMAQDVFPQEVSTLEKNYYVPVITEKTIEGIKRHPKFYLGAPVRVKMGKIYKTGEFEKRSDEVLSRELPGGEDKKPSLKRLFVSKKKQ